MFGQPTSSLTYWRINDSQEACVAKNPIDELYLHQHFHWFLESSTSIRVVGSNRVRRAASDQARLAGQAGAN